MPAARYWRVVGLQSIAGGPLELSALHLYLAGNRVDASATLTCTVPPASGAVAGLQDNDTATVCRWLDVSAPGFALVWDFGSAQLVDALRLGSGVSQAEFAESLILQSSSDGANWASFPVAVKGWSGANAMAVLSSFDPEYSRVSLLLPLDVITTFSDKSPAPKAVTSAGNALISTAQSKFGGASLLLDGIGSYLTAPASDAYIFGTGDFTLEAWINTTDNGEKQLVDQYTTGLDTWQWAVKGGKLTWYHRAGGVGSYALTGAVSVNDGLWHHIAAARNSGVLRFFVDGALDGSVGNTTNYMQSVLLGIGGQVASRNSVYDFAGALDDVRITKGVARYIANFTPPTEPFFSASGTVLRPRAAPAAIHLSGGMAGTAVTTLPTPGPTHDLQDAGNYCVYGTVELKGTFLDTPLRRRVQLYNQRDGRMVRETWSDATTGTYRFDGIRGGDGTVYFVATFDHTQDKRAVIADGLVPEVLP